MNKNIYLLSTDKPSRLCYDKDDNLLFAPNVGFTIANGKHHIYITNDEEIKGETVAINLRFNCIQKVNPPENVDYNIFNKCFKKIILTTDQDLINYGVQAIDDEFLEWFVKNPSCERVEVKEDKHLFCKHCDTLHSTFGDGINCDLCRKQSQPYLKTLSYKIIIPQEEPKYPIGGYAPGNYRCNCVTCKTTFQGDKRAVQCESCAIQMTKEEPKQETKCLTKLELAKNIAAIGIGKEEPKQEKTFEDVLDESLAKGKVILEELKAINAKQETLEKAAERYADDWEEIHPELDSDNITPEEVSKIDFIAGAKSDAAKEYWFEKFQQEQDKNKYSEEEVLNILQKTEVSKTSILQLGMKEWFERSKKK
jgi:hypothetical protein